MTRIGIIICDRYRGCAGGKCLRALRERATPADPEPMRNEDMKRSVAALPVDIEASIPVGTYTLREILALKANDVIELHPPLRVDVSAGGVESFTGTPGNVGGRWAVSITSDGGPQDDR